jgi:hypothetical protein
VLATGNDDAAGMPGGAPPDGATDMSVAADDQDRLLHHQRQG